MSTKPDLSLELSPQAMQRLVDRALERIIAHIKSLPQQPAHDVEGGLELALSARESLPEEGEDLEVVLDYLFQRLIPKTFNTASPGYLAYIPGGGLFQSAVADLISNSVNRYVGVWTAAPGLGQLEANVISWLCRLMGYPESARGFLTSGGSLSIFSALYTARCERLPENFLKGVIYASDQVHHSVAKAARLVGLPAGNVRLIESDEQFRLPPDLVRSRIRRDRSGGWQPFLVVGSAGTTNTGAVDDLDGLADLAKEQKLWFHVDAAYGGVFVLTRKGRQLLAGIERADSITLDPHKGLFLPYGTGSLLVRDGAALRRAHSVRGDYMPALQDDPRLVDFCEISPELSRDFRGLRLWLPFKLHGIQPFRSNLEEKLELTSWIGPRLAALPGIEIVTPTTLTVIVFRYHDPLLENSALNSLNRRLLEAINRRRRVYLTSTRLDGRFVIRLCILSFRTHLDQVKQCLEDVEAALEEVVGERLNQS